MMRNVVIFVRDDNEKIKALRKMDRDGCIWNDGSMPLDTGVDDDIAILHLRYRKITMSRRDGQTLNSVRDIYPDVITVSEYLLMEE